MEKRKCIYCNKILKKYNKSGFCNNQCEDRNENYDMWNRIGM